VYSLNNESLTADKAELSAYFAGLLDSCQRLTRQTKSVLIAQRNFICTKILVNGGAKKEPRGGVVGTSPDA
jgi:hypothetical protein